MSVAPTPDALVPELDELSGGVVLPDEPMSQHTSFRTGGPVRAFVQPSSKASLLETLAWLRREGIGTVVVGGGGNVLWADGPFDGVVVNLELAANGLDFQPAGRVEAGGGVRLRRLLTEAQARDLAGFSFLLGIPGTVGGAVRMNAGTSLGQMANVLEAAEVVDEAGEIRHQAS